MKIGQFLKESKLSVGDNASFLLERLGLNDGEVLRILESRIGETAKMSKSKGNIVDPEDAVKRWGADTVRLYILFAGPPEQDFEWTDEGIQGAYRFLSRLWNFVTEREEKLRASESSHEELRTAEGNARDLRGEIHSCLRDYLRDIEERYQLNTAVAQTMKLLNSLSDFEPESDLDWKVLREGVRILLLMLAPITPHICEELWERIGESGLILEAGVPVVDEEALKKDEIEVPVQINGKVRSRVNVPAEAGEEEVKSIVLSDQKVKKYTDGKEIKRFIYVRNKLINIVIG